MANLRRMIFVLAEIQSFVHAISRGLGSFLTGLRSSVWEFAIQRCRDSLPRFK